MSFEVVCCLRLFDSLAHRYLTPVAMHPEVSRLWVVRHAPIEYGDIPKVEYVITHGRTKATRFARMFAACQRLGKRKQVRAFVSFNPFPYGLFSFVAAKRNSKAIHFGFIGSDWAHVDGPLRRLLLPVVRRADCITATGEGMKARMKQLNIGERKVRVLPHSIPLERFPISDPEDAEYACVFVGQLIKRKNVATILQAWAIVMEQNASARLCVVGDGPLSAELKSLASVLGIAKGVDFVGYQRNVQPYLAMSKIVVIASSLEGFPFALVEGMSSGLVPISTPVASIPEFVVDGQTGLLFPINEPNALARCILRLIDNPELYHRLRQNVLQLRSQFAYEEATAVWDNWFREEDSILDFCET